MGRGRLWCFGDEDFRGQQEPDHAGRILQRGATYLGGIEDASVHEVHIGVGNSVIPDHVGGGLDPLHHRSPLNTGVQRNLPHRLFERPFDDVDTDLAITLELQSLQGWQCPDVRQSSTRHHAFFHGRARGMERIFQPRFFLFQCGFSRRADLDHRDATDQFRQAPVEVLAIVI